MNNDLSALFQPLVIGRGVRKVTLKNRMVMAPMVTCSANRFGEVTQRTVDYYTTRARGGVGTIITEAIDIDDQMLSGRLGIFHDRQITEFEYLAGSIKENGAVAVGQINQTGLRGNLPGPDDLSREQIEELIAAFGRAAGRVQKAGFDAVMLHGAHGYLISSFLSPLTNHRKDGYGGDAEQRTRFATDVVQAVRQAVGEDFPIFFRMNGDDFLPGGLTVKEALVTAPILEAASVDVLSVSSGVGIMASNLSLGDNKTYFQMIMPMYLPRGCRVELGAQIKKKLKIPMSIVGRINDPHLARDIVAQGKADLVDMGRQMIADPFFPQKIAEGRLEDIRQCIACNYCHGRRMRMAKHVHCAVNPLAGREAEFKDIQFHPPAQKVMVIGGGVAGMEAARWLTARGLRVSLYEKSPQLGGQALLASLPIDKGEIQTLVDFLKRQIKKLGVDLILNSEVTPELVLQQKPDAIVVATGGKQIQPRSIPVDPKMKSIPAWTVLLEKGKPLGSKVVVLGGGFVAAEITEFMAVHKMARDLTMVEMREAIAFDMDLNFRQMLMGRLQALGIKMVTDCCVERVTATEVVGRDCRDIRQTKRLAADAVVVALGTESVKFPAEAIQKAGIKIFTVGDAQEPHGIAEAVRSGYLAGITVGQKSMVG